MNPGHDPIVMLTFPSIKSREPAGTLGDKTTCQILCLAEHEWFKKYAELPTRKRGAEYKALKRAWGERLVKVLLRFYPQLEGRIELLDVSTPLSIEHYLASDEGGAVGLDQSPQRFSDWNVVKWLDARTPIEGLWLTGQDTVTCGQPIVQAAGLISAFRILGVQQSLRYLAHTLPPIARGLRRRPADDASAGTERKGNREQQAPGTAPATEGLVAAEE